MRRSTRNLDLERRDRQRLVAAAKAYQDTILRTFQPGRYVGWLDGLRGRTGVIERVEWPARKREAIVVIRAETGGLAWVRASKIRVVSNEALTE